MLRVPHLRLRSWIWSERRSWGKRQMRCCVCVFCVNSYCKWDLKNWHSHLSSALRLSQTNEGPEPQSEIDISFSTSQGILWIWRGFLQSQGIQRAAPLFSFLHLLCPLIFTHSSYVLAAEMSTSKAQLMGQKSTLSEIGFGIKSEQSTVSSGLEAQPYISLSDWKLFNLCGGSSPEPSH